MEEYLMKVVTVGDLTIQSFRSHRTHTHLRQLPLSAFYSAASPNSGPLALLYRKYDQKTYQLPTSQHSTHILIFNCKGQLLRQIPFELKQRIILFEFTSDERLLIIYATALWILVDTATGSIHQGVYMEMENKSRCVGAEIVGEKVVIVKDKTIGVVEEIQGKWKPLNSSIKLHSQFLLFQCSQLDNHDIQIVYLNASYQIQLYRHSKDNSKSEVIFQHPDLKTLAPLLVTLSHHNGQLVLVFTEFMLWIDVNDQKNKVNSTSGSSKIGLTFSGLTEKGIQQVKNIFKDRTVWFKLFKVEKQDPMSKSNSTRKYRNFYISGWLGQIFYFSDRRKLLFSSSTSPSVEQLLCSQYSYLLASGKNILRLIDEHTYVLRGIDDPIYYWLSGQIEATEKCLKRSKDKQGIEVYQNFRDMARAYENYCQRKPTELSLLKQLESKAEEVLDRLLVAVQEALDAGLQLKMLKMAQWVQTKFGVRRDLKELVGRLRVVNGLKYEHLSRWLSLTEFQALKNDRFLMMLLKSNMHYVSDLIFLDSASKKKIFMHWAKCKIQKQIPIVAIEQIKQRYQDMKRDLHSKFVFTQLSLYVLHRSTPLHDMALRLAQNEPHPARKCIVFLLVFKSKKSIELVDKLLDFAQHSFSTGAMHRTLQTLRQSNSQELPAKVWQQLLPRRPMLQALYFHLLKAQNDQEQLQQYLQTTKNYKDLAYLSLSRQLKGISDSSLEAARELIQTQYSKLLPNLSDQIGKCQRKEHMVILKELKNSKGPLKVEQVPENAKDGDLEFLGELAANRDDDMGLALRIFRKIKGDKVYDILRAKGKMREALDVAFERKAKGRLQLLIDQAEVENAAYGRQLLQQLSANRR